ncbi:MAG: hypothetical protein PHF10_03260 [Patescibacteria group bacterium]|nr:hypothetical protein [Patescibacteria group bacterium]MDD5534743.1 hypothetical protein [Patescibacteria group bacterium]
MAKIIKKSFPWFLILSLIVAVVFSFNLNFKNSEVKADSADTSVTVGNTAPSLGTPAENPASYGTTPTNIGANVTFESTSTDPNSDNWYLAVCKTNVINPGTGGGAPTCDTSSTWCVSTTTVSGAKATCVAEASGVAESNVWYAFACDAAASSQACSASSQGASDSGSPFKVNHVPAFTVYADDGPKAPAVTMTWTTTAADTDTDTASDTVSLYVCKSNAFVASTLTCTDGAWCSDTAKSSNPTCGATTLRPDGDYAAYGFVVDSHGLEASGSPHATDSTPTVSNATPSITASTISVLDTDEADNMTLTTEQAVTTGFKVKFTVVDANSCVVKGGTPGTNNEIASSFINLRMSEKATTSCDESGEYDANDCYPDASASWDPSCTQDADTCTGTTDTDAAWTCTFPIQYHADATVTGAPKASYNWVAAVKATDDDTADTGLVDSTTGSNEMDKFMSYDLTTTTISYGTVSANGDSSEKTTTVEATGNVGLDENISGGTSGSKGLCTGSYPTCSGSYIATDQQNYNLTTAQGWGGSGHADLAYVAAEAELNCAKTTTTGSPATANTYWYLHVPTGQAAGSYTGQNTIEGKINNETYGS